MEQNWQNICWIKKNNPMRSRAALTLDRQTDTNKSLKQESAEQGWGRGLSGSILTGRRPHFGGSNRQRDEGSPPPQEPRGAELGSEGEAGMARPREPCRGAID
jgi:hypothetical protein